MRNLRGHGWPKIVLLLSTAAVLSLAASLPARATAEAMSDDLVARVNGDQITKSEFDAFFFRYVRSKFYHSVPPERLNALRRAALDEIVLNQLLLQEAERREIAADRAGVDAKIDALQARYKDSQDWPRIEEQLPELRTNLLRSSQVTALRDHIQSVAEPSDRELQAFYRRNIALFTQPKQVHLSVILVGVDPSALSDVWQEAEAKAGDLRAEVDAGADFSALARENSTHESAPRGGDLGYVHAGMLSEAAQQAVDKLNSGQVTSPVRVLEGFALFRLLGRKPPQVHDFEAVRDRALALFQRRQSETRWQAFLAQLKEAAAIELHPALTGATETAPEHPG